MALFNHRKLPVPRFCQSLIALLELVVLFTACVATTQAWEMGRLDLAAGKSTLLRSGAAVKRISIADPAIADFVLISPYEVYITAKASGATNLILWHDKGLYDIYDIAVTFDIAELKQHLHQILPEEKDLRVSAMPDAVMLSGRASTAANLSQALTLCKSYAPKGKVNNLVEVRGVQQVMLEVRVAEMQRSLIRRLGVNFNFVTQDGNFGISQLAGLTQVVKASDANIGSTAPLGTFVSSAVNALFRFETNGTSWTGFIDALKSDGLVKVLAEPTLTALSGEEAFFNAGGEFPVPVPQDLGTVTIEYRTFGVGLKFTPTVLADNKINIRVAPEVSELDFSTAVQFNGFVVPGLSSRKAETVVELADGQSFAIAGLLRETVRDAMDKFPLLGDIPIIGALFRSRAFQKNETELVIIVTPRLVKPLVAGTQSLPTDFYVEPSDVDVFIAGMMQGRAKGDAGNLNGKLDGQFGHARPR